MSGGLPQGVSFGPFRLFPSQRRLEKDGATVQLGSRALDLLAALAEKPGEVLGKQELLSRAWPDLTVDESSLRFHIASLRKMLGEGENGARYIANIPGRGYCLVAPVQPIELQPDAASPPCLGFPQRLGRMVGRDEVVSRISQKLASQRFVTIHGPGGIGKTTVAVAVAHRQENSYGGNVHFLDLAPLAEPALVGNALASVLGIVAQSDDPTPEILDFLRDRRILIVLDSCEHLVGPVSELAERIYQDAPAVSILTTSRERLRVEGEHVFALPPLDLPPRNRVLTADEILSFSAPHLFAERTAAMGYNLDFTDADAAVVADICCKLDGIALAIELVASRAATHGLHETAALIGSRLALLWRGRRTAPPRHQTLQATLDWSYQLLGETERVVLRRAAVFVGPFPLTAAVAVVADPSLSELDVVQAIDDLSAKSLMVVQGSDGVTEYRLLDTARDYAHAKLVEAGEQGLMAQRHAGHIHDMLRERRTPLFKDDPPCRLPLSLGDVHAALRWCFSEQGDSTLFPSLASAAAGLFLELSSLNESRRWSEAGLSRMSQAVCGSRIELELTAALGHSLMFTESNGEATLAALNRSLAIAQDIDDPIEQFRILARLHMYHRRTGKIARLDTISREARELAAVIGDPAAVAAAHNLVGVSLHLAGDQPGARLNLEKALQMGEFRRIAPGHFAFHRNPHIALARCLWLQGFPDQATAAAAPLMSEQAIPDPVTHCIALIWGAAVFQWAGDWTTFGCLAERLRAHAVSHSLGPYQALALGMGGQCLINAGQLDSGIAHLREAIGALRSHHYELYLAPLNAWLAIGLARRGETAEARQVIDAALEAILAEGGSLELPELLRIRGEVQLRQGEVGRAQASFDQAIACADRQGALSWRLRAEISLAKLLSRTHGRNEATRSLAVIYGRFTEGFATEDLKAARLLIGPSAAAVE